MRSLRQYINEDGTLKEGVTADALPDGYYLATVDGKEKVCEKINDKDVPIKAIFRIQIDAFEFKGFDKAQNGRALFYCYYGNVYNNAEVTKTAGRTNSALFTICPIRTRGAGFPPRLRFFRLLPCA